jgi:hypothetical protein
MVYTHFLSELCAQSCVTEVSTLKRTGLKNFRHGIVGLLRQATEKWTKLEGNANGPPCSASYCIVTYIYSNAAKKDEHVSAIDSSPGRCECEVQEVDKPLPGAPSGHISDREASVGLHDVWNASEFPYIYPQLTAAVVDRQAAAPYPSTSNATGEAVSLHISPSPCNQAGVSSVSKADESGQQVRESSATPIDDDLSYIYPLPCNSRIPTCDHSTAESGVTTRQPLKALAGTAGADFPYIYPLPCNSRIPTCDHSTSESGVTTWQPLKALAGTAGADFPYIYPVPYNSHVATCDRSTAASGVTTRQPLKALAGTAGADFPYIYPLPCNSHIATCDRSTAESGVTTRQPLQALAETARAEFPYIYPAPCGPAVTCDVSSTGSSALAQQPCTASAPSQQPCTASAAPTQQPWTAPVASTRQPQAAFTAAKQVDFPYIYASLCSTAHAKVDFRTLPDVTRQPSTPYGAHTQSPSPYIYSEPSAPTSATITCKVSSTPADEQLRTEGSNLHRRSSTVLGSFPNLFSSKNLVNSDGGTTGMESPEASVQPEGREEIPRFEQLEAAAVKAMSEEQDVKDPWAWDMERGDADDVDVRVDGPLGNALRGQFPMRRMKSWTEMKAWVAKYEGTKNLYPTEISRMWTQLVEVCL